jgi:hypothetical protein
MDWPAATVSGAPEVVVMQDALKTTLRVVWPVAPV